MATRVLARTHPRMISIVCGLTLGAPGVAWAQALLPPPPPTDASTTVYTGSAVRLATERAVPPNVVVTDLGVILTGGVIVGYERAMTPSFSVLGSLRFQYGQSPLLLGSSYFLKNNAEFGIGAELELRVYFRGYAPDGWFFGARVAMLAQDSNGVGRPASPSGIVTFAGDKFHLQTGATFGYQWIIARHFVLTLGVGASLVVVDGRAEGFHIPLRLAVGGAF